VSNPKLEVRRLGNEAGCLGIKIIESIFGSKIIESIFRKELNQCSLIMLKKRNLTTTQMQ